MASKNSIIEKAKAFAAGKENPAEQEKPKHLQQYDITHTQYPKDLTTDTSKPLPPYVMFYINVSGDSKIARKNNKAMFVEDVEPRKNGTLKRMARNSQDSQAFEWSIYGTSAATSAGLLSMIGLSGGASLATTGVGIYALESQGLSFSKPTKRLKHAIALHMPNQLNMSYQANYQQKDSSAFLAASKIIGNVGVTPAKGFVDKIGNSNTDLKNADDLAIEAEENIRNTVTGMIEGVKKSSGAAANLALGLMPGGDVVSNLSGIAANPMLHSVFVGVQPRQFTYEYSFYPKDEEELENIHKIVKLFKTNMLPEYKENSEEFLFVYPSEFDIVYYTGGQENKYINKHTSCVLERMEISYTPDGTYTFFNSTGAPTRINIRLQFLELDIVTREDAEVGY